VDKTPLQRRPQTLREATERDRQQAASWTALLDARPAQCIGVTVGSHQASLSGRAPDPAIHPRTRSPHRCGRSPLAILCRPLFLCLSGADAQPSPAASVGDSLIGGNLPESLCGPLCQGMRNFDTPVSFICTIVLKSSESSSESRGSIMGPSTASSAHSARRNVAPFLENRKAPRPTLAVTSSPSLYSS